MELADGTRDVVDPEVRAYVSSLVTALGGSGADEEGRYILGDDALACLRDLKRWLKLYDEKANRLDVARCLAEANLVDGDLLRILATWPEHETDDKFKSRLSLACLELLVPLTWPFDNAREMTVNHHRHTPYLQLAQVGYKRSIINFDDTRILHTAIRVALPSMAIPISERTSRDEGIIRLVLYFLRNIAMISPPPNLQYDGDESEISRSATIDAFEYQDIFHVLLAFCSTMGEDFNTQDVVIVEIIFHLIRGIDIEKLFMDETELDSHKADELLSLRIQEAGMLRSYARTAPSRHNRFGTMIWVKRENEKMSTVSGQAALIDHAKTLAQMDKSKKFKPPRRGDKSGSDPVSLDFDTPQTLDPRANKSLRTFVEDFLDSGFNPLFHHVRKTIDRQAERVLEYHPRQFFYLISWFLEAERVRRKAKKASMPKKGAPVLETESFSLLASVLNQEMFITLNRAMEMALEEKRWQDLNAAMKCFTQILLTVQEMSESPLEDDQDIAENTLNRIFYEETTHDRVANIVRFYKDQGFGYLDACTELAHVYIRLLENYSKQNTDLQIRSKRRVRRKKKTAHSEEADGEEGDNLAQESEGDEEAQAERTSRERKFDFKRFAHRFATQGCIDTFVTFTGFYSALNQEQLKRAQRYFYRIAFKMDMSVMLFRIDIIALFHKMIRGPDGLSSGLPIFKEWDELTKQLIKKCTRKIEERPELIVELLFSKTSSTFHYLQYGYEKQTLTGTNSRPAAELEVKPGMDWEQQVAVVVSSLLDRNEGHHLDWVKQQLSDAVNERRSWEVAHNSLAAPDHSLDRDTLSNQSIEELDKISPVGNLQPPPIVVRPDSDTRRIALFKNGHLRLLITLLGFSRLSEVDDPDTSWVIPSTMSADQITQALDIVKKAEFDPPVFDDGREAADFIRRKSAGVNRGRRAVFDDDSDGIDDGEEDFLFPAGGPTAMRRSDALDALKKTRRRRRKAESDDDGANGLTDEQLQVREDARNAREIEKRRKIKSALYVHDSDDEDNEERDREFFEQEERIRNRQKIAAMKQLLSASKPKMVGDEVVAPSKKRSADDVSINEDEDLADGFERERSSQSGLDDELTSEVENATTDTPLSSPQTRPSRSKRARVESGQSSPIASPVTKDVSMVNIAELDDEDEDEAEEFSMAPPLRRRVVGGFIDDSSEDE